eukprot:2642991-Rhodomonas_salina.1
MTVCEVQNEGSLRILSDARLCSLIVLPDKARGRTSIPAPGSGQDVISLRLVSSVTYTTSAKR